MKKKVLHVLPDFGIGGINRFVLDLVYYQKQHPAVEIGVYIVSNRNTQWKGLLDELEVKSYWDTLSTFDWHLSHYSQFLKVKGEYDIIHWHVFMPILCLLSFGDDKIHVFTHHSVLGIGRQHRRIDKIKWFLFRQWVNHRLDCEVYNSLYTQSFWQQWGIRAQRQVMIYNGMRFPKNHKETISDLEEVYQHFLNGRFIVGTSSNFIAWKRIDVLIRAFSAWAKDKKDVGLFLVGDGTERVSLERLCHTLGVDEKVYFAGHQKNVMLYQASMDVCVFPSTTETFGLAALECLYLGKPTLCMSDGGGICEVVGDENNILTSIDALEQRFDYFYLQKKKYGTCDSVQYTQRALNFQMKDKATEYVDLYLSL